MLREQSLHQVNRKSSPRMIWLGLLAVLIFCGNVLAQSKESAMSQHTSYRTVKVDGLSIFYREAGPKDCADHSAASRTSVVVAHV